MKILIIGGTGTISTAISQALVEGGQELWLLNRGNTDRAPAGAHLIQANADDEADVAAKLGEQRFDAVCDFRCFLPVQAERDFRLFRNRTDQFVFISSASAYQTPLRDYVITEGTALANPLWEYSRNKIACEEFLLRQYRENGFPVTIVRPSHTYCERSIPIGVHGRRGSWQVLRRMLDGKPVIVQGDGTSLWTVTDSRDFAKGFIGLLGNSHAIGEAFQITSDETLTWNQIYEAVAKALGVELKPYYVSSAFLASVSDYDFTGSLLGDKASSVVFDNSKLKRAVPDFRPSISFAEGARRAVAYILSHPECQTPDEEFDAWCDRVIAALERAKSEI